LGAANFWGAPKNSLSAEAWRHRLLLGGGVVNQLAVKLGPDLAAGVPFYGAQPSAEDAATIKAPINAQYGELDTRITGGWPAFDAALTEP
jgi:carboxymethylenebutenolidase